MRKLLIIIGVLSVLILAAIIILPSLIPASVYKDKITDQLTSSLNREVKINGDVKLSVIPVLMAKAENVTISNPQGFSASEFASMEALNAKVKLWPLFRKQVEIKEFVLQKPKINLVKKENGQTNWLFGQESKQDNNKKQEKDKVFKRDGRYPDLQISLGNFTIKDGQINYQDRNGNKNYEIKSVNTTLSFPGLDKRIASKGEMIVNGKNINLDFWLDTPRAFLDGKKSPFFANIKSDLGLLKLEGFFIPSENIGFEAKIGSDIPSLAEIDKFMGMKNPYGELAETASFNGYIIYDGKNISANNADIIIKSGLINTNFKGEFDYGNNASAKGDLQIDIINVQKIMKIFNQDIPALAVVDKMKISTDLDTDGKKTNAKNLVIDIKGEKLTAQYKGEAIYQKDISITGNFTAQSPSLAELLQQLGFQIEGADILGDMQISGQIAGGVKAMNLTNIDFKTKGGDLQADYSGDIILGETTRLNGKLKASSESIPALVSGLGLKEIKPVNALQGFDFTANIAGTPDNIEINNINFDSKGNLVKASYQGLVKKGEKLELDGSFAFDILSVSEFIKQSELEIAVSKLAKKGAFGKLSTKGKIKGFADGLDIKDLSADLSDGLVNFNFKGALSSGLKASDKKISYHGNVGFFITDIRKLAELNGTVLPPDTDKGKIFTRLEISGQINGDSIRADFTSAKLLFDDLRASGKMSASMAKKLFINSKMNMDGLDLRPYQAAIYANRPKGIIPWSEAELNLGFLNSFDGDFILDTPNIKTLSVEMGQSKINTRLRDGILTTKIPEFSMYGGSGVLDFSLNAKGEIPQIEMDFDLQNINAKGFLGAAAGFTKLSGNTGTKIHIKGQGRSQAQIMRSLSGGGNFELAQGLVQGVNLGEFVKNLNNMDNLLKTRTLPAGLGAGQSTSFDKISGLFTIKDGIVNIGKFSLNANNIIAEGVGSLDIGGQSVNFGLRPYIKGGKGLSAYGIPIRFSGKFGSVSASLDTDMVMKILAARAREEVESAIKDEIGGVVGDILGGTNTPPTSDPANDNNTNDKVEDVAKDLIGGILGGNKQKETVPANDNNENDNNANDNNSEKQNENNSENSANTDEQKNEDEKPKDPLDKALKDLLGGG